MNLYTSIYIYNERMIGGGKKIYIYILGGGYWLIVGGYTSLQYIYCSFLYSNLSPLYTRVYYFT